MITIYGLIDPAEPDRVRYIGVTDDPKNRLVVHCTSRSGVAYVWARSVIDAGRNPKLVVLAQSRVKRSALKKEGSLIHFYRNRGMADLNRKLPRVQKRPISPRKGVVWGLTCPPGCVGPGWKVPGLNGRVYGRA